MIYFATLLIVFTRIQVFILKLFLSPNLLSNAGISYIGLYVGDIEEACGYARCN